MKTRAVTLLELVIVVVIIGILVSLLIPQFLKTRERARDRAAITGLKLILNAEKVYLDKYGAYFPRNESNSNATVTESDIVKINNGLGIDLGYCETDWDYSITATGRRDALNVLASATRIGPPPGYARYWYVTHSPGQGGDPNLPGRDLPVCQGSGCPRQITW